MRTITGTIIVIFVTCMAATRTLGQAVTRSTDTLKKPTAPVRNIKPKGPPPITHEMSGGIRLNTDGWSLYTDLGRLKTNDPKHIDMFHNVRFWELEFSEKKNAKEYKSTSVTGTGSNTYIYGKINNFYAVKLGWGYRKMLAGKPDPGTVSIHWVNAFGFSLGLLKPYYLNVYSDPSAVRYKDDTKSDFLNQGLIEGNAGFSKGLNEMKFIPGGHLKSALHFDFSANKKTALAVEVGANAEYYSQPIPLMANQVATPYFVDMFIAMQFGKRW